MRILSPKFAITVVVLLLVWSGLILILQRKFIFPRASDGAKAVRAPSDAVELSITTNEGTSRAWLYSAKGPKTPLLVYLHGNGETVSDLRPMIHFYVSRGFSVLAPEYRGYGQSDGAPSESGIVSDLRELVERAKSLESVDPSRVVFHGFSLGGGFAVALAKHSRPNALILESTFRSIPSVARRFWVPSFLVLDELGSEKTLQTLKMPLLVIHGRDDTLIPKDHGEALARAGGGTLKILPGGHGTVAHGGPYTQAVEEFLGPLIH